MKKFTFLSTLLAVALLFSACDAKKSNNGTEEPTQPVTTKLISSIDGNVAGVELTINFTYNADNQLTNASMTSPMISLNSDYTYEAGFIRADASITSEGYSINAHLLYTLDSQGRISKLEVNPSSIGADETLDYQYNSDNQLISYTYEMTEVTSFHWTGDNCTGATREPNRTEIIYSNDINRNDLNFPLMFVVDDIFGFLNARGTEMISSIHSSLIGNNLGYNLPSEIVTYTNNVEQTREAVTYTLDSEGYLSTVNAGGTAYTINYK